MKTPKSVHLERKTKAGGDGEVAIVRGRFWTVQWKYLQGNRNAMNTALPHYKFPAKFS